MIINPTHRFLANDGLEAVIRPAVQGLVHALNLQSHLQHGVFRYTGTDAIVRPLGKVGEQQKSQRSVCVIIFNDIPVQRT